MRTGMLSSNAILATLAFGSMLAAQSPSRNEPGPGAAAVGGAHALTAYSAGLEGILVDPKDKGLLAALRMIDDRVLELPAELEEPIPGPPIQFVLDLVMGPISLRAGALDAPPADDEVPPIYGQLDFWGRDAAAAKALADRFSGMMRAMGPPSQPAPGEPGLNVMQLDMTPAFFGVSEKTPNAFTLALNKVDPSELQIPAEGLAPVATPALAFKLDAGRLRPLFDMMIEEEGGDPHAAAHLELMGLYGENAVTMSGAIGYAADRAHSVFRYEGYRTLLGVDAALLAERLNPNDLRRVPADATFAKVSKFDLSQFGDALTQLVQRIAASSGEDVPDPMALIDQQTGIHPQRDIFAHLGSTMGAYTSDTTGGGGLFSLAGFIEVKNPQGLSDTLARVSSMLNHQAQVNAKGYIRIAERKVKDQTITVLTFPGVPVPLELCWSIADGYLYAAGSPQALVAAIEHGRGTKASLNDNPRFKEMGGDKLSDAIQVSFIDTPKLMRDGYGLVSLAMSALSNVVRSPSNSQRDPGLIMPSYADLAANAKASVTIARVVGDDLVITGQLDRSWLVNSCGAVGMLGGSTGVATTALAAGVLLPALGKARETAKATQGAAQLRHLSVAVMTYAHERNGEMPANMQALLNGGYLTPDMLNSPVGPVEDGGDDLWLNTSIKSIDDGGYSDRLVLGYDRAMYASGAKVNVVFFDGHVQIMSVDEFDEMLGEEPNAEIDFELPE